MPDKALSASRAGAGSATHRGHNMSCCQLNGSACNCRASAARARRCSATWVNAESSPRSTAAPARRQSTPATSMPMPPYCAHKPPRNDGGAAGGIGSAGNMATVTLSYGSPSMALTTRALILPVCWLRSTPGRGLTNTSAVECWGLSDRGFFSGTETCTRACTTPPLLESGDESSCDRAWVKRARSSSADDTKPSFLNTWPRVSKESRGNPPACKISTAREKSSGRVLTTKALPSREAAFSACRPALRNTATISLAWRSVNWPYSSCWEHAARSASVTVTRARAGQEGVLAFRALAPGMGQVRRCVLAVSSGLMRYSGQGGRSGLLAEQLLQPVRGAVGDVGGELAVEQKLVRPDGQHDHLTRGHVVARSHGRLRMFLQRGGLGVDVFKRFEEGLHALARCLHRLGL